MDNPQFLQDALHLGYALTQSHIEKVWTENVPPDCIATVIKLHDGELASAGWGAITEPLPPTRNSLILLGSSERHVMEHELSHARAYCTNPWWVLNYYSDPASREKDAEDGSWDFHKIILNWDKEIK